MLGLDAGLLCLALNIFFEARSEPVKAQYAVALVTINRAKKRRMSLCEVVFEPHQFSWTEERMHKDPKPDNPAWILAQRIARRAITVKDFTDGSTYYHREDVFPKWRLRLQFTGKYGKHLFYKER